MADTNEPSGAGDPHNLKRFVQAQVPMYVQALSEIRNGRKMSHWMALIARHQADILEACAGSIGAGG